ETQAMLEAEGLRLDAIQKVPHSWNLDDLLKGRIDALSAYSTNESYLLRQLGADCVQLRPSSYGVDFYGDLLFTTQAFATKNRDLTEAFRRASFKGWEYAMEHPEELIDYILTLPSVAARGTTRGKLQFEAEQMRDLVLPGLVDLGHINPGRLHRIEEILVKQGIVKSVREHDGFVFSPRTSGPPTWLRVMKVWLLVALGAALIAILWITQLRRSLKSQAAALANEARERQHTSEALRSSLERYDHLVARIPIGVYLIRSKPDGTIGFDYLSPRMAELFGLELEPLRADIQLAFQVVHPDDSDAFVKLNQDGLKYLTPFNWEGRIVVDGEIRWLHIASTPERLDTGDVLWHGVAAEITERQRMLDALRQSEQRLRALFEGAPIGMFHTTLEGHFIRVNGAQSSLFGYANTQEMLEQTNPEGAANDLWVPPEARATFVEQVLAAQGRYLQKEVRFRRKDGTFFDGILFMRVTQHQDLEEPYLEGFLQDLSERKQAEEVRENLNAQLVQAQKMEVVGRLAGGVAHDFNNMLGVIMGRADLGLLQVPPESPIGVSLKEILKAAQHSADLTRQLLAFARKQTVTPRVLNLNDTVDGLLKMLRRLIGEAIDLVWMPSAGLWPLKMDPTQINQILANLCVNARDAIQGTGKVIIETKNVLLDARDCAAHLGWEPGQFILLTIRDSGSGIAPEAIDHIFEPFFTTKGAGQGTGLGLATVYGIVQQNNGFIEVVSALDQGTCFNIYLPRTTLAKEEPSDETPKPAPRGHGETLLVVEDEESLRTLSGEALERLGYRVLAAAAPGEALALMQAHQQEISLVITDVIMPGMNGRELVEKLIAMKPGLKCLFMSGYPANIIAHQGALIEGLAFLPKPFSFQELAAKVHEVLGVE
ncbi:MAG: PAS domain S-box protein, partial [Holophaga sp.]|nr:PAS domain S-box protein [Holophaga sp.]